MITYRILHIETSATKNNLKLISKSMLLMPTFITVSIVDASRQWDNERSKDLIFYPLLYLYLYM